MFRRPITDQIKYKKRSGEKLDTNKTPKYNSKIKNIIPVILTPYVVSPYISLYTNKFVA